MRIQDFKPALVSIASALAASSCCLLPLAVIVLGLGSGAFMATTMRYQTILLPLGILGVAMGYTLYFRERRRCRTVVCRMAGSRLNAVMLGMATLVLVGELVLVAFPRAASELFTQAMVSAADRVEHFDAKGTIVAVDPEKGTVTIDHGEIKGLMSPMKMAFPLQAPELLQGITPGDRVAFQLLRTPQTLEVVALATEAPAGLKQVVLDVQGMTWATWPLLVQQALEGLPGVKQAEASFAKKQAVVRYEPDKVSVEEMIVAIKHIGFSASLRE